MHEQISDKLEEAEAELHGIPEIPAHSAVRIVSDTILSFSLSVCKEMEGDYDHTVWHNTWESIRNAFNESLEMMKPVLVTRGNLDEGIFLFIRSGTSAAETILIESSDEEDQNGDVVMENAPAKKRKREESTPAPLPFKTPTKIPIRASVAPPTHPKMLNKPVVLSARGQKAALKVTDFAALRKQFDLDEVAKHVNQSSKSKVPGHIHPKVREAMMRSATEYWHRPVDTFFSSLEKELRAQMRQLFDVAFKEWQGSELHRSAWSIVDGLLEKNLTEQRTRMAARSLDDEREGPYIFFQDQFRRDKEIIRDIYAQSRRRARMRLLKDEAQQHDPPLVGNALDKFLKEAAKMAALDEEPYSREIDLVVDVRAYYDLAARRLHDSICMRIESKFFKQLRTQLRSELESKLGIYDAKQG